MTGYTNKSPCIKLLLSARDPGAATNIIPLAQAAMKRDEFEVFIYAAEPAYSMIQQKKIPVSLFHAKAVQSADDPAYEKLRLEAKTILAKIQPDVLVAGLSNPDAGIDEALLLESQGERKYLLQDFWGKVNNVFKPDAACFVIDEAAAKLTHHLHGLPAIVTGMPKYVQSEGLDTMHTRARLRAHLKLKQQDRLVTFFGQPLLWQFRGYTKTLKKFTDALARSDHRVFLFYRQHPKESDQQAQQAVEAMSAAGITCYLAEEFNTQEWLIASDITCSVLSNCGYDQIMLNRVSDKPLGTVIYLLFEKDIFEWYKQTFKMDSLPPAKQNLAYCVTQEERLSMILNKGLNLEDQRKLWMRIKEHIPEPHESINTILNVILTADKEGFSGISRPEKNCRN